MDIKGLSAVQKYAAAKPATEPSTQIGVTEAAKNVGSDFAN
jgi:flagellar hook-basal body complex protein FliE